jgi:hypothetical protein
MVWKITSIITFGATPWFERSHPSSYLVQLHGLVIIFGATPWSKGLKDHIHHHIWCNSMVWKITSITIFSATLWSDHHIWCNSMVHRHISCNSMVWKITGVTKQHSNLIILTSTLSLQIYFQLNRQLFVI